MLPPLRAFVTSDNYYAHDIVAERPDGECFICKEPYTADDPDSCRAMRLKSCGHIIGDKCFQRWIIKHPQCCPYWNHKLSPARRPREKETISPLVRWFCESRWFEFWDEGTIQLAAIADPDSFWGCMFAKDAERRYELIGRQLADEDIFPIMRCSAILTVGFALVIIGVYAFVGWPLAAIGGVLRYAFTGHWSLWWEPFLCGSFFIAFNAFLFLGMVYGLILVGRMVGKTSNFD